MTTGLLSDIEFNSTVAALLRDIEFNSTVAALLREYDGVFSEETVVRFVQESLERWPAPTVHS